MSSQTRTGDEGGGFASAAERRKRLGQFFTGARLARLLAALADARDADSICDPMLGNGDMLLACADLGSKAHRLDGIEIDPVAYRQAQERLASAFGNAATVSTVLGDAFNSASHTGLAGSGYGLLITNPPYVRYQSTTKGAGDQNWLPSAEHVRRGLIDCLAKSPSVADEDRRLLTELARGYSGLSDLAVPSWILAASMVREGGRLAVVVPEAWLSRDYATPIRYLLLRWFDVEFLVEDVHAAWFDDALVKTTLLIARRAPRREAALTPDDRGYLHIRLRKEAADARSTVGALYPDSDLPDVEFARQARHWLSGRANVSQRAVSVAWVPASTMSDAVRSIASGQAWLQSVEPGVSSGRSAPVALPAELASLVTRTGSKPQFVTLNALGWSTGQGLRTGANDFFYVKAVDASETHLEVEASNRLGSRRFSVRRDATRPVVRRQSALPDALSIKSDELTDHVLVLDGYALPEDIEAAAAAVPSLQSEIDGAWRPIDEPFADHIRRAATTTVGSGETAKPIPELSAVAPNVRAPAAGDPAILPRYWYMLPPFTDRHLPALLMPRVQGSRAHAYLNPGRRVVVDANFSTLWPTTDDAIPAEALLAILNSTWIAANLEVTASVMGGGALKVEAAHLRRIPIPILGDDESTRLEVLGQKLATASGGEIQGVIEDIDSIIAHAVAGNASFADELANLASSRRQERAT